MSETVVNENKVKTIKVAIYCLNNKKRTEYIFTLFVNKEIIWNYNTTSWQTRFTKVTLVSCINWIVSENSEINDYEIALDGVVKECINDQAISTNVHQNTQQVSYQLTIYKNRSN